MCIKFQPCRLTVSEKRVTKNFNVWKLERKKNEEIKGWKRAATWFWYTRYICPLSMCIPSSNLLGLTVPEKSVTKNFNVWKFERKKNEEIKEWISNSSLIPVYTIHLPTVHMCTKFQSSRPHSSWEKCDEKFLMFENWREKKKEKKKGQICSSILIPVYKIQLSNVHVYTKFQSSRPLSSWEKCEEKFLMFEIGEKEKWRIKGMNRQQQPHSGIHDISVHCPPVYQVSIF